jgi:hypothetical protein
MNQRTVLSVVITFAALCVATQAQLEAQETSTQATKDSAAVSLASNALTAMTGGVAISDVTLSAQVIRTVGSDSESGAATLEALSAGDASLTYSLGGGQRAEIINPSSSPRGAWSGPDGVWHQMALHNSWTPATWFAPTLVLEAALVDPQLSIENLGSAIIEGEAVEHLRVWRVLPSISGSSATLALIQGLSTVDIYLDATSNLPVALDFNLHPDSNAGVNIPVEVRYSNWQRSSGALMPFHIQRFFNGSLLDDISVSSATVNSGLSSSSFNVPATSGGAQ